MGDDITLVLPAPLRASGEEWLVESQACNGLARWADNFERVTVAAPALPDEAAGSLGGVVWEPLSSLACFDRVEVVALPYAYTLLMFVLTLHATRSLLRQHILQAR